MQNAKQHVKWTKYIKKRKVNQKKSKNKSFKGRGGQRNFIILQAISLSFDVDEQ